MRPLRTCFRPPPGRILFVNWTRRCYSRLVYSRHAINALLMLSGAFAMAQQPAQPSEPAQLKSLVIQGIGKGIVPIDGDWQFHIGDDLSWAQPSFDDSGWEPIRTDATWGEQGHPSYTGFAWYRRHIEIVPGPGDDGNYSIFILDAENAYELYWNGKLIGQYGKLPPHAYWYYAPFPKSFPLTGSTKGVLAIRVWKAPLDAFDPAESGGVRILRRSAIPTRSLFAWPNANGSSSALTSSTTVWSCCAAFIALSAFSCGIATARNRDIYSCGFRFTPPHPSPSIFSISLFRIPLPWNVARALNQPIYALYHVSLWFLLLWLLRLHDNGKLVR